MAWNEPGKDNDPWKRPNNGGQRPPELDEVVKKLQKRFGSVLGGGGGGGGDVPPIPGIVKLLLIGGLILAGIFASAYRVDAGAKGVVQRFGAFVKEVDPGLNWRIPLVDKVTIVRVDLSQEFDTQNEMLTGDANIISVSLNVQYRHATAKDYVFNVRGPDETLQEVTDAAIRAVVGKYRLEEIQRGKRDEVAREALQLLQSNLDRYGTGIVIDTLNLNETEFPVQVQEAAQDVIKAARDKERFILQAEAYRNDLLPRARGEASRSIAEAQAYKDKLIADARGETTRFLSLLAQYEAAPEVTRERLYLEAVESVLGNSSKVLMDSEGSGNVLYLPIDKLMERSGQTPRVPVGVQNRPQNPPPTSNTTASATDSRLRSRDR